MEAYTGFAQVYDKFMDNIDYEQWCKYLIKILRKYGINEGIVLDLGCGTGNVTKRLSAEGYDMIGLDNSEDMLNIAMRKRGDDESILYLLQDMREFELYGTVSAIVSICDSLNYITDISDLRQVLKLVNNYLDPQGILVFDIRTKKSYEDIGECVIAEDREECSFIWENYFDNSDNINEYQLSLFVKASDERYDKFVETHYQRAYSLQEIKQTIDEAGLEFIGTYNAFTEDAASEDNDRVYVIAREHGKPTDNIE